MDWGTPRVAAVCVFAFGVSGEGLFFFFFCLVFVLCVCFVCFFCFFYDAICATTRKARIVRACERPHHHLHTHPDPPPPPLWVIVPVEALMAIPFELPTLPFFFFFHGLKSLSVRQGKQGGNGHFSGPSDYVRPDCPCVFVLWWFWFLQQSEKRKRKKHKRKEKT